MSLMASLVTISRMQQCFNVLIDIYHELLVLFYWSILLEIILTTTTTTTTTATTATTTTTTTTTTSSTTISSCGALRPDYDVRHGTQIDQVTQGVMAWIMSW